MTASMRPQPRPGTVKRRVIQEPAVRSATVARTGGAAFMWLIAVIALGSAMCLLVLNTLRSEQAFTLTSLQGRVAQLDDQQQALQSDIAALSAPEAIAMKADSMGMVHASSVKFIQRSNGKLLGVSTSPQAGTAIAVNTLPQTAASSAASDVLAAGGIGTHVGSSTSAGTPSNKAQNSASQAQGKQGVSAKGAAVQRQGVTYGRSLRTHEKSSVVAPHRVLQHVLVQPAKK